MSVTKLSKELIEELFGDTFLDAKWSKNLLLLKNLVR